MKIADFSQPVHPYQEQYVPPNHLTSQDNHYFYRLVDGSYQHGQGHR